MILWMLGSGGTGEGMRSHFVSPRIVVLQFHTVNDRAAALPPERAMSVGWATSVLNFLQHFARTA